MGGVFFGLGSCWLVLGIRGEGDVGLFCVSGD